jgi:hypothetical protein
MMHDRATGKAASGYLAKLRAQSRLIIPEAYFGIRFHTHFHI